MTNEEFEPLRIRIMKEAYDLSDKDDTEGFNAIKVMCGEVQEGVTAWAEKLLEDAERYRWMRERHENTIMDIYNSIPAMTSPELLDAAIDAERNKKK